MHVTLTTVVLPELTSTVLACDCRSNNDDHQQQNTPCSGGGQVSTEVLNDRNYQNSSKHSTHARIQVQHNAAGASICSCCRLQFALQLQHY